MKYDGEMNDNVLTQLNLVSATPLFNGSSWYTVELKADADTVETVTYLREVGCFDKVDYDYIMKADAEVESVDISGNTYAEDVEEKIKNIGSSPSAGSSGGGNERDDYFEEAGRFIIEKDKASIGMLQRVLKIGFNRAARIMDQLCEYGVVGEEEGTKPRKVLMSLEQFEQLLEEI